MKLIEKTETHEIYVAEYEGTPVRFLKNLKTDEISIMTEDIAQVLGYEDEHQMLSQDCVLDALNDSFKETGVWPLLQVSSDRNQLPVNILEKEMRNDLVNNLKEASKEQIIELVMRVYEILDWTLDPNGDTSLLELCCIQLETIGSELSQPNFKAKNDHE